MALNALVSACVYGLLTRYGKSLVPGVVGDRVMTSIVAGFGAMALLRSKFFTIRTEKGEDVAVGPDAAVSAFLHAADRAIDRRRASRRLAVVFRQAREIQPSVAGTDFLQVSLAAFQNLSTQEKIDLKDKLDKIASQPYPDELKLQAMCYLILIVSGERNFNEMMSSLRTWAKEYPGTHTPPTV